MSSSTQNTLCKPYDGGIWIPSRVLVEIARLNKAQKQSPRMSGVEANRRLGSLIKTMQKLISEDKRKGNNPMSIPDLDPMYERLKEFIKKHQGGKGFILTDDSRCDTIWAICYSEIANQAEEYEVKAVRVDKGAIEVMVDFSGVTYTENDVIVRAASKSKDFTGQWLQLRWDDYLYYIPTIFNIAENIHEYV